MEKQPQDQLELFSNSDEDLKSLYKKPQTSYFAKYIWGYEKTILIVIAILIASIVSFSLGVEKGKRIKNPVKPEVNTYVKLNENLLPKEEATKEQVALVSNFKRDTYTIQVASFKTDTYAKKEAESLKRRGYIPITLNKGEHVILCVGNYSNKEEAQALLSELRKYYKDCRIRRL